MPVYQGAELFMQRIYQKKGFGDFRLRFSQFWAGHGEVNAVNHQKNTASPNASQNTAKMRPLMPCEFAKKRLDYANYGF